MAPSPESLLICDATLREADPQAGQRMSLAEKLRIARALVELRVDVLEAGTPAASQADWDSVNAIARECEGSVVSAVARCSPIEIDLAARALQPAPRRRLHLVLSAASLQQQGVLQGAVDGVRAARDVCEDIQFSVDNAARAEHELLAHIVEGVIDAGATTVGISDTSGCTMPDELSELFRYLKQNARGIRDIALSIHGRDDLGMAVANSLAAVVAGARQIECTVNGVGQHAGNCSLEEIVTAIRTRDAFFNLRTNIEVTRLYPVARLVSETTGMAIPRNIEAALRKLEGAAATSGNGVAKEPGRVEYNPQAFTGSGAAPPAQIELHL
jgi:2-isopropylmalate synthase